MLNAKRDAHHAPIGRGRMTRVLAATLATSLLCTLITYPAASAKDLSGEGTGAQPSVSPQQARASERVRANEADRVREMRQQGLPPTGSALSRLNKNGKLSATFLIDAHRNQFAKGKARNLAAERDIVRLTVLVTKPGVPASGPLTADDVVARRDITRRVPGDGLATFKVRIPKKFAKKALAKPALLERLSISIQHFKDLDARGSGFELVQANRLHADSLARPPRRAPKRVLQQMTGTKFFRFKTPVVVKARKQNRASTTYTEPKNGWNHLYIKGNNDDFNAGYDPGEGSWMNAGYTVAVDNGCGGAKNSCYSLLFHNDNGDQYASTTEIQKATYPVGLNITNNTPYNIALTYAPLSCTAGIATPPLPSDDPAQLAAGATYQDINFTSIDSKWSAVGSEKVGQIVANAAKAAVGTAWRTFWGTQKQKWAYSEDPKNSKGVVRSTTSNAIVGISAGYKFISSFLRAWLHDKCSNSGISSLWTVNATPLSVDEEKLATGSPQTWNYNGLRTKTVTNPDTGQAPVVTKNQPVGVGGVPVPPSWKAPTREYIDAHIGLTSQATWRWAGGNPDNAPNPDADSNDGNQSGTTGYQGGLIQTVDPATGTVYINFLGTDSAEFGPNPVGTVGDRLAAMRASAEPGGETNPGGVNLACYPGTWNLTTPWSEVGAGTYSNAELKSIVVDSSPSITAAAGVGFHVSFQVYDQDGVELYSPDLLPPNNIDTPPDLDDTPSAPGIDALPIFIPVVQKEPAAALLTREDLKRLVYADGTPFNGEPAHYGCTFVGITSIPQGQSFAQVASGGAGRNNNQQWQSIPYAVTTAKVGEPIMITAPQILNQPAESAVTSEAEVIATTGEWKNVSKMAFGWFDCGMDSTCSAPVGRRMGTNTLQVVPGADPNTDFAPGDYVTFEVQVESYTGEFDRYRTKPFQINGPGAALDAPRLQFEGDSGHTSIVIQQAASSGANEYILRYWTTTASCARANSANPNACTWTQVPIGQIWYPSGSVKVELDDKATSTVTRDANSAIRATVESKYQSKLGVNAQPVTYTSPVYIGYTATKPQYVMAPVF